MRTLILLAAATMLAGCSKREVCAVCGERPVKSSLSREEGGGTIYMCPNKHLWNR